MKNYYYIRSTNCKGYAVLYPQKKYEGFNKADGTEMDLSTFKDTIFHFARTAKYVEFLPILDCVGLDSLIISSEFKDIITPLCSDYPHIEFIPVFVSKDNIEKKQYYIMHFTKFEEVIDFDNSVIMPYIPTGDFLVMAPSLYYDKIESLNIFCINALSNQIISQDVYRALRRVFKKGIKYDKVHFNPSLIQSEHE